MKKLYAVFLIITSLSIQISAQTSIPAGKIVFMDGEVDVLRAGKVLDWRMIDIGYEVEVFDIIETGPDGMVELSIYGGSGSASTVFINPGTVFAVENTGTRGSGETSLQMMRGAVSVRVGRLSGRESVTLRTESAVMGVRGTSFDVISSPEGGVLVTCESGEVSCRDNRGNEVFARPGAVVENVPERRIAAIQIAVEDIELYQQYWMHTRQQVFRSGAEMFIQSYVNQYRAAQPRFEQAYSKLSAKRSLLEKYGRKDAGFSLGELIQARGDASPAVVEMRSILPVFEMIYFRLQELKGYHDEGHGRSMIEPGLSSDDFFKDFSSAAKDMNRKISDTRYMLKLYSIIHEESGGGPSILDDPFGGESIFEGPPGGGLDFQGF